MTPSFSLDYGLVAFIDVLGFSAMVEGDSKGSNPKYLPVFLEVFEEVADSAKGSGCEVKMFSDSIIVESELTPSKIVGLLSIAKSMQKLFLRRNILVRGGVAFGKHFSNERVTFSQALINAYHLESKVAKFPRVVISDDVLNFAWHHADTDEKIRADIRNLVCRDRDDSAFIDYITNEATEQYKHLISSYITQNINAGDSVLEKIRWLLDYYNYCARDAEGGHLNIHGLGRDFSSLATID